METHVMSFLDSIVGQLGGKDGLGSMLSGGAVDGVTDLINQQGGVGGLVGKLTQGGLGDVAASWVGSGPNAAVSADQLTDVLGSGPIAGFAEKLGVNPAQAAGVLAMVLPLVISHLTPKGQVEDGPVQGGGLGDLLGGALGGSLGNILGGAGGSGGGAAGGLGGLLGGLLKK
jgi:uncharacterized protein YidB (DUF937 family)